MELTRGVRGARGLPAAVPILVAMVAAGGLGCVLARVTDVARWTGADLIAFVMLAAGIAVTEQFQIPVRHGADALNFSLTEALWVGALILSRASVLSMALVVGVVVGHGLRRVAAHKVAFNAGQFLLAVTAAQVVVGALRSPQPLRPVTFVAAGLGMGVYAAINAGLVALVIALAQGKPFRSVLLPPLPENVLHFAVNTALGLSAVVLWRSTPGAVSLLILPLAMAFLAYQAMLAAMNEGTRPVVQ